MIGGLIVCLVVALVIIVALSSWGLRWVMRAHEAEEALERIITGEGRRR